MRIYTKDPLLLLFGGSSTSEGDPINLKMFNLVNLEILWDFMTRVCSIPVGTGHGKYSTDWGMVFCRNKMCSCYH